MLRALQRRDFSATVLRHTTPDAQRQTPGTRDEHVQVCFLALTHSLMPEKVPNRGTKQNRFPGYPEHPSQGARSIGKLRLTPVAGREKLPPNKAGRQRPGRSCLDPKRIGKPP